MEETIAKALLEGLTYPWEALPKISEFILELGSKLDPEIYELKGGVVVDGVKVIPKRVKIKKKDETPMFSYDEELQKEAQAAEAAEQEA